jgi:hypothetical protein
VSGDAGAPYFFQEPAVGQVVEQGDGLLVKIGVAVKSA